jgi:hypothetical protein
MPLWGANSDPAVASTNKPKFLSSAAAFSTGLNAANTYGVSVAEQANTAKGVTQGWVRARKHTGYVLSVLVANNVSGGFTVNNNVSVTFAANAGGSGANANAVFVAGNLTSIVVDAPGSGYTNTPSVILVGGNPGVNSGLQFTVTMGGRANRTEFETLVALNDVTGDDSANDNFIFGA